MRALICGFDGQDGAYLVDILLVNGCKVWGTSRSAQICAMYNFPKFSLSQRMNLRSMAQNDFPCVLNVLVKHQSKKVSFQAAQSSVGFSFEQPVETQESTAMGPKEQLTLGRLDIARDRGEAHDYADAMCRVLQQIQPQDYVIATGITTTLRDFISAAFAKVGLHWQDHVVTDSKLYRPSDISWSQGDPIRARKELAWQASLARPILACRLVDVALQQAK